MWEMWIRSTKLVASGSIIHFQQLLSKYIGPPNVAMAHSIQCNNLQHSEQVFNNRLYYIGFITFFVLLHVLFFTGAWLRAASLNCCSSSEAVVPKLFTVPYPFRHSISSYVLIRSAWKLHFVFILFMAFCPVPDLLCVWIFHCSSVCWIPLLEISVSQ